ncbi:MAG: hypothetical protein Q3X20_03495 [Adlercreutzia sp.]|nr:hypothetical protein [Adlercreutzia sp.]
MVFVAFQDSIRFSIFRLSIYAFLDDMQVVYGPDGKNAKLKRGEMAKMQSFEAARGAAVSGFCKEKVPVLRNGDFEVCERGC